MSSYKILIDTFVRNRQYRRLPGADQEALYLRHGSQFTSEQTSEPCGIVEEAAPVELTPEFGLLSQADRVILKCGHHVSVTVFVVNKAHTEDGQGFIYPHDQATVGVLDNPELRLQPALEDEWFITLGNRAHDLRFQSSESSKHAIRHNNFISVQARGHGKAHSPMRWYEMVPLFTNIAKMR